MDGPSKSKERIYWLILFAYTAALILLFWNQYRPRVLLAKCSEIALASSQSYSRNQLNIDNNAKTYEELLTECIQNFSN